ncbi:sugar dehydrogenase complex small subunit [Serratia sp. M24T3]|uniref:sugar dehydrogenase complex small subunit n=1 Tax=Serratia sp. M24T3 TaxID=932213 RepID=UPI00025BAE3E|nr:sugar dehydrogenase complex small subunit [Serratia sp. M24T3]EIC83417.1 twin-arginine translocation pathway signal [Serratia sp. M24T3]
MSENNHPESVTRRRLLQGIGVLSLSALTASLFPALKVQAQEMNSSGFAPISSFLVSRPANPLLSQRYYNALIKNYPDFPTRLSALKTYLDGQHFAHMDDFIAAIDHADPRYTTARLIVSAWYTGIVGEDKNIELVAYADAMMYLPIRGILVIPTYGGGPDSWGPKPVDPPAAEGANV